MTGDACHWRIALPWLAEEPGRLQGERERAALDWLLARADRSPATRPWREWVLEGAGLGDQVLGRFPAGPCVRTAWTGEPAVGRWACAGPVHLLTALDHLRLAAPAPLPIGDDESAGLVAALNERLAGAGFALSAIPRRGWLCACPHDLECDAPEPASAVGGDLRDWLPKGRDARRVSAWVNHAQMILHDQPLNAARVARGEPPVNSVWLWGIGTAGRPARTVESVLLTDDDWLAGLWRLHGGRTVSPVGRDAVAPSTRVPGTIRIAVVAGPAQRSATDGPSRSEYPLFATIRTALGRRTTDRVSIHAGAEVLHLDRRARWKIWRRARPLSRGAE